MGIIFPTAANNSYRGHRLGLWLFSLMLYKIAMGINVMRDARSVARNVDGIPIEKFSGEAQAAFSFASRLGGSRNSCWGC